jgi:hypothetical protein
MIILTSWEYTDPTIGAVGMTAMTISVKAVSSHTPLYLF